MHPIKKRLKLYGLDISIENPKGSTRKWYDPHGKEAGSTYMHYDYGYCCGSKGTDGDHVDIYVGPDPDATTVYLVDQMKKPPGAIVKDGKAWDKFDEQKVMLAFPSAAAAKAAYMKQYDDPRFFGGMKEMSVEEFKAKALHPDNHGKKIASEIQRFGQLMVELNLSRVAMGEPVVMPPEIKLSSRAGRIADRVDDAGIGLLAAPYVADVAGGAMSRSANPKLKAMGTAVKKGLGHDSAFGKSHGREIAGLAMVAPGVTHTVAKTVNKALPKERLEKVASKLFPDYEYMTESEKTAILGMLGRMVGRAAPAAAKAVTTALPSAAKTVAPAAKTLAKSKWNPLSGRNLALGAGAATIGLGAYGGYKGIQTAGKIVQNTHEAPLAVPGFAGMGRVV